MLCALRQRLEELEANRQGSVAIIFAIAALVLVGVTGASVDYARAYGVRSRLVNVIDGALLAAAPMARDGSSAVSSAFARNITAQWATGYHGAGDPKVVSVTVKDSLVVANVSILVPTTFVQVLGLESINVEATSEVRVGAGDTEIALVLDNTGSMEGSRLEALKKSAASLIDIVYATPNSDSHVRVSLVPFSRYVNVGLWNRNALWMNVPADSSTEQETCWNEAPVLSRTNCRTESGTYVDDGVTKSYTYEACDVTYGEPVKRCTMQTVSSTWNGCVGSRSHPLNMRDADYGTRIPGIMNATCTAPITPLTNSTSKLRNVINEMVATGDTYIPEGLMWGWRTLSAGAPYDEAAPYTGAGSAKRVRKILVLMTDGANTRSPTYPEHDGGDAALANQLTLEACAAIRSAGIEIFTIAFEVTDATARGVLQSCASPGGGRFFEAVTNAQLQAAFESIAQGVVALRISR